MNELSSRIILMYIYFFLGKPKQKILHFDSSV